MVDYSQPKIGFSRPLDLIPDYLSQLHMGWGYLLTVLGFILLLWQKNKQPMRTRNIYFNVVELICQLLLVRTVMGQTVSDPCFMNYVFALVCITAEKWMLIAQVSSVTNSYIVR
jgi:hypothetical protein